MKKIKILQAMLSLSMIVVVVFSIFSITLSASTKESADTKKTSEVKLQNVGTGKDLTSGYAILNNDISVRVGTMDYSTESGYYAFNVNGVTLQISPCVVVHGYSDYICGLNIGAADHRDSQLTDIWNTSKDKYFQDFVFYRCNNGNYIIRMAENPDIAIASTSSKGVVKLVKFDESSKYQQWAMTDSEDNRIYVLNESTTSKPKFLNLINPFIIDYKTNNVARKCGA